MPPHTALLLVLIKSPLTLWLLKNFVSLCQTSACANLTYRCSSSCSVLRLQRPDWSDLDGSLNDVHAVTCPQPLRQLNRHFSANCSSQIPWPPSDPGAALQSVWQSHGPQRRVLRSQLSVQASSHTVCYDPLTAELSETYQSSQYITVTLSASVQCWHLYLFSSKISDFRLIFLIFLPHFVHPLLVNVVHSLYGCGSPHSMALDAAKGTSPCLSAPPTPSVPSAPPTPQFIVPPSPPPPAPPRHILNSPTAPMPISQRYRPYSVTSPWGAPFPSSPGQRGFSLFGPSPSPAGPAVPPNTPVPAQPSSPQQLPLSSPRARNQPPCTPPLAVPSSLRLNTRQAAFASRIPPSRYLLFHVHVSLWCKHTKTFLWAARFKVKCAKSFNLTFCLISLFFFLISTVPQPAVTVCC